MRRLPRGRTIGARLNNSSQAGDSLMRSIRRILVAIKDPEAKTTPALVKAGQLARALGAQIELFHGIASRLYVDGYGPSGIELPTIERLEGEASAAAQSALDRTLRTTRIQKKHRHIVGRHPADAIAQTAQELHSSIVVMGAISRSGLKRLFIGNTAERVLDLLSCDVLVVKPEHFASRVPRARRGARVVAVASTALSI
jgi:nucleotide-binding universal stress UspA family protein